MLASALALAAVAAAALPSTPGAPHPQFDAWMVLHGKSYPPEEYPHRLSIFLDNVATINAHNAGNHTWTMAVNEFADLTAKEFKAARTGGYRPLRRRSKPQLRSSRSLFMRLPTLRDYEEEANAGSNPSGSPGPNPSNSPGPGPNPSGSPGPGPGPNPSNSPGPHPTPSNGPVPSGSVDWTTKGAVTPVKNQGQCGSCWTFSTTGSVEGIGFIKGGSLKSLSEQQILDCSTEYPNAGCNGGLYDVAFKYLISNGGACSESSYPYTGAQGTCKSSCTPITKISGYQDVTPNSDSALASAIAQQPVSISIEANSQCFQFYSSGVLTCACGTNIDHAVLAVGYGVDSNTPYFKVKNSWGASWGQAGYVLIARGASYNGGEGQCGIYNSPAYPTI